MKKKKKSFQSSTNHLEELSGGGRRIETHSQGWFDLASVLEIHFSSVKIGPFKEEENVQYYTNSVGLIKDSEAY
ncbi:hypothetical protein [Leptospira stimsonii]|uniref:hypothetical protein n=1 Tax=Leptospira stimsonii TaxID=2202203 RepID=UPI001FEE09FD|nr:hypothetical protein [Leptospira stimsonii]